MKIFIANDDGIDSVGLKALAERLARDNDVLVVAPDSNRSVCSHSLTIRKGITLTEKIGRGYKAYSIDGFPVDCVKVLMHLFPEFKADVIVSGINKAHNVGADTYYSGTVAVAYEGAYYGIPSFAFSAYSHGEDSPFDLYADYAANIIENLLPISDSKVVWNVNFPNNDVSVRGVKFTKLSAQTYKDTYELLPDKTYRLKSESIPLSDIIQNDGQSSDLALVKQGYVTITPMKTDRTDYVKLAEAENLCIKL